MELFDCLLVALIGSPLLHIPRRKAVSRERLLLAGCRPNSLHTCTRLERLQLAHCRTSCGEIPFRKAAGRERRLLAGSCPFVSSSVSDHYAANFGHYHSQFCAVGMRP